EIDSTPDVFHSRQNGLNCTASPRIGMFHVERFYISSPATHTQIILRSFHLVLCQFPCNLVRSFSIQTHIKYSADNFGCFFVNLPLIGIVSTLFITIATTIVCVCLATHSSRL